MRRNSSEVAAIKSRPQSIIRVHTGCTFLKTLTQITVITSSAVSQAKEGSGKKKDGIDKYKNRLFEVNAKKSNMKIPINYFNRH